MSDERVERRLCERHCIKHEETDSCNCGEILEAVEKDNEIDTEPCTSDHVEFYKIKSSMVLGFVLTWIALLAMTVWVFIDSRDLFQTKTVIEVNKLKIENIENECSALRHKK